jgi:monovalent cation:H+ antiporter, CPA1 family
VLVWGGLRGALPMVLVLSLPPGFPYRDQLVSMTFGVAVLSILIQRLTMSGLPSWLGIVGEAVGSTDYEIQSGRLEAAAAALRELDSLAVLRSAPEGVIEVLRTEYSGIAKVVEGELQKRDLARVRRHLLDVERDRIQESFRQGALGRKSHEHLLAAIDAGRMASEVDGETAGK